MGFRSRKEGDTETGQVVDDTQSLPNVRDKRIMLVVFFLFAY